MLRCIKTRTSICPEKAITEETCIKCYIIRALDVAKEGGMKKVFAKAIMRAQEIHEKSYDVPGAKEAEKIAEKKGFSHVAMLDYERFYGKSLMTSADEAVKESGLEYEFAYIIYLLCKYCWNDCQSWADTKT